MKKTIALATTLIVLAMGVKAQDEGQDLILRHLKGVKMLEGIGGITKPGKTFGAAYIHYIQNKWYVSPEFNYETGKVGVTNFKDYTGIFTFNYCAFDIKERLYFNLGLGPQVGVNKINEYTTDDKTFTFKPLQTLYYGGIGRFNIEYFINKSTAISTSINQFYMNANPMGATKYEILGSIRITIN